RTVRAWGWLAVPGIAAWGCSRGHSVLRPVSIEAQPQAWLTGALFGIIAALVRQNPRPPTPATGSAQDDRGRIRAVVTAVGATAVVLAVVVAASLAAGPHRERAGPPDA